MTGSIIVGIIIAIMFLTAFTEWFYHLAVGINESLVRDIFLSYRIGVWVLIGASFFVGFFWLLSLNTECPLLEEEKPGIFKYMNCDVYWEARSFVQGKSVSALLEEAAELNNSRENQSL